MEFTVSVVTQKDGSFLATCRELPRFEASGGDYEACDRSIMQAFLICLMSVVDTREDIHLQVRYLGLSPAETEQQNWELVMPKHVH